MPTRKSAKERQPAKKELSASGVRTKIKRSSGKQTQQTSGEWDAGYAEPFPIVGIGASAGGLEAVAAFLKALSPRSGMAFVLVQHLDPRHESMLNRLLAKDTDMFVSQVERGMRVERNHFYVIPPNRNMTIRHGVLQLSMRADSEGKHMPIDHFFTSLAHDQGKWAIGIILSGTATDGTVGLQAIKSEGGITFAQDQRSAKYPGMPMSAAAAGCVDFVLPPAEIAGELARMGRHPYLGKAAGIQEVELPFEGKDDFQKILAILKGATGVDFTLYKPATIRRRIARRMALLKLDRLDQYAAHLRQQPAEAKALYEDILIHVTGFFREPESFEALQHAIVPKLIKERKAGDTIRVWVPGCSTGEEVYSIAICLLESLGKRSSQIPIQIFGTDISVQSIERARTGFYTDSNVSGLSDERLRRFFVKVEGGYQISKAVRDMCLFARHDLAKDPPFSRLDLISCRNVLIYMGSALQKRVMAVFHYSLKPAGHLLLGKSESLSAYSNLFTLLNRKARFYSRRATPTPPLSELAALNYYEEPVALRGGGRVRTEVDFDLQKAAERIIWQRYAPAAFVVDADLRVLHFQGDTSRYLAPTPGEASLHLLRLVREEIALELRTLAQKARKEELPRRKEGIRLVDGGLPWSVNLEVIPIRGRLAKGVDLLIMLEEVPRPGTPQTGAEGLLQAGKKSGGEAAARLRQEVVATREYLQSIIEDRETANEELKAANEEILSSNEELQSTNEELETAKEELQSTNEELTTLNEELQNRNTELNQLSNDLSNLLAGVNIPIVILGSNLKIRRFTPTAERLLSLIPTDVGRPIGDLKLNIDAPDLGEMIAEVTRSARTAERDVQGGDGRWYSLRLRPYRTSENRIEGVLIALVDIDVVRRSRNLVAAERDFSDTLLQTVGALVFVLDLERRILVFNRACQEATGYNLEEVKGKQPGALLIPPEEAGLFEATLARVQRGEEAGPVETAWITKDGRRRLISWAAKGMRDPLGSMSYVIVAGVDITARRASENAQRATSEALVRSQAELRALAASLLQMQEDEHSRIARELHDGLSQKLAGLLMGVEALKIGCEKAEGAEEILRHVREGADSLAGLLKQVAGDAHDLARRLHPSTLEHLGLMAAVESLCTGSFNHGGLQVKFSHRRLPLDVPADIALCLYRVAQEALHNVAKHSRSTEAQVRLSGTDTSVGLTVVDKGSGFDPETAKGGLGLISMRERVRLVNGELSIKSGPGRGTEISVKVPLPQYR